VHDDNDAACFARRFAIIAAPHAARRQDRVAMRKRRRQSVVLELAPRGGVDFTAAGNRCAEIQRVTHEQLLIRATGQDVFAPPFQLTAAQQRQRKQADQPQFHCRFASNKR